MTRLMQFANNATSRLAATLSAVGTTVTVIPGDGSKFPSLTAGQYFMATLIKADGSKEVVKVTARASDTLTIVRAAEAVGGVQTAYSFNAADRIDLRLTAGELASEFDRLDRHALTGVLNKSANYTAVEADASNLIRVDSTAAACTITLPQISTLTEDFIIAVSKVSGDNNAVYIAGSGGNTINGATPYALVSQWQGAWLVADRSTNTWTAVSSGIGSSFIFVDKFTGTGAQTAFTLTAGVYSSNQVDVTISGVTQNPGIDYTATGTTLTFTTAPPNATVILARYTQSAPQVTTGTCTIERQVATLGQTGFALANGYIPGSNTMQVFVNGLLLSLGIDYTEAGTNAVAFTSGLSAGDEVQFVVYGKTVSAADSGNVGYTPAGTGAVATTVHGKLRESVSVLDFGANTTPGTTDMTEAIYAACTATGTSGTVFFPKGNYRIQSGTYASFTCGVMRFDGGAILVPDAGSVFTIFADIEAGSHQIFNVGKTVLACDCQEGTTQVTSWTYGFQASDVGKLITVPFGGEKIGAAPGAAYVQNRNSFTTTIASYTTDNSITLSAALISSIRQNYVYNAGFANQNTGYVIVGNGTITLTPKVGKVNVKWFGATGDGSTDDSFNINKALLSATRQYGGLSFYFPPGTYALGNEILLDVQGTTLTCDHHLTTLFRKNGIAAERMNVIKAVWRGRYGGGNPSATSESWSWSATEYVWVADWAIMYDILIENFIINGNQANQPVIPTGTGHDGWDSGISTLYVGRGTYRNLMVVNTQRWGIALSTLSSNSLITGCFADTCNEGAYYAETSSDIRIIGNYSFNSPAADWNMGAITFLTIAQGEIADNVINGGNNGVYVRGATVGVSVTGNSIKIPATYGIWTFDETSTGGVNAPRFLSITGNTIDTPGSYAIRNSWSSDLAVSNNTINTTGTGVYFNNTPRVTYADNLITGAATNYNNAGGNSIVFLDDSGTFTPTIEGSTTAGTATYGTQSGRWQRRGRIVTFDLVVSWTTATGTGNLQVQLPFATASADNSIFNALAYNFAYTGNAVAVGSGGSNFATMWNINGGTPSQIPVAASGTIWLSGSFEM